MTTANPSTSKPKSHSRLVKPGHKFRLREASVDAAKPNKAKAYMLWDTGQRGLGLRVLPTGRKAWKYVYSRSSRPRWLHLGSADAIGLSEARMMAAEAMLAVARGRDPAAEKRAEKSQGTFEELAAAYVTQYAQKHNKSWKQAEALIRSHVLPRLGKLQVSSIVRSDIKAMLAKIGAPIMSNQVLASVSAVFTWAKREEMLSGENPCRGIDRNDTTDRARVLADSEVPQFWQAFDDAGLVASSALKVILLTGQRPGEVAHMRREHIVDGGWWKMPGLPTPDGWPGTKNKQPHDVWLPKAVRELISELTDDDKSSGFIFVNARGRPVARLDDAMRTICNALDIADKVTPHDLRRTFLTKVTGLKFGRDAMDRIANHKEKGKVTDTYDRHGYGSEDQQIMETTAARIIALAEGQTDAKVLPFTR
jgi:integrase